MAFTDSIIIRSLDQMPATELQQIDTRLKALILTVEHSVPGSRGFGTSREFLHDNVNFAATILAEELQEKADTYIPEINIENIDAEYDLYGRMRMTIEISRRDTYDTGTE